MHKIFFVHLIQLLFQVLNIVNCLPTHDDYARDGEDTEDQLEDTGQDHQPGPDCLVKR